MQARGVYRIEYTYSLTLTIAPAWLALVESYVVSVMLGYRGKNMRLLRGNGVICSRCKLFNYRSQNIDRYLSCKLLCIPFSGLKRVFKCIGNCGSKRVVKGKIRK